MCIGWYTVIGILQNKIDFLYPIKLDRNPKKRVPITAPRAKNAPIQPAIAYEMGPSDNGVEFDMSSGSAGANHPMLQPCEKATMFAIYRQCHRQFINIYFPLKYYNIYFITNTRCQKLVLNLVEIITNHVLF